MNCKRQNLALYFQKKFTENNISILPSCRLDESPSGPIFTPRVTLVYEISDDLKFSANTGKAWRAPTFNELYYPADNWGMKGNQNLKPEYGIVSDVGIQYKITSIVLSATAFLTDTKDLILWGQSAPENIGKSRQSGLELELKHKISSGFYHHLNYTYLMAENLETHAMLPYKPQNTLNYDISYFLLSNTELNLNACYISEQFVSAYDSSQKLPPYTLLNVGISQKINDVEIWAKINNITDKKYQIRYSYPLPGINFVCGINIKFLE
jgi:outer membrane cobalamin receptor